MLTTIESRLAQNLEVADIGSGSGSFSKAALKVGVKPYMCEPDEEMYNFAVESISSFYRLLMRKEVLESAPRGKWCFELWPEAKEVFIIESASGCFIG